MESSAIFVSCLAVLVIIGPVFSAPLQRQESRDKIEALKTKLEDLHKVLEDLEHKISKNEAREVSDDSTGDVKLADFENKLSDSDKELLDKMKSRVKYLKSALETPAKREQEEEASDNQLLEKYPSFAHFLDAAKASLRTGSESTDEKRGNVNENPELQQLFENLSEEDKELLQKHPSQLNVVKAALLSKHDDANEEKKEKAKSDNSDKEEALLEDLKTKLSEIKTALQKDRQEKCKNDPNCYKQPSVKIKEGKFGDFVKINKQDQEKEISSNWMQTPIDEVPAPEKCKPGSRDCECRDGKCNKEDTISHNEMVQKIKKKLLDDVADAKSNGVATSELIRALMNARRERRVIVEEKKASRNERLFM